MINLFNNLISVGISIWVNVPLIARVSSFKNWFTTSISESAVDVDKFH